MDCMDACVKKGAVTDRRKHAALVRRVAVLLAAGKRQKEIAAELGVTPARAYSLIFFYRRHGVADLDCLYSMAEIAEGVRLRDAAAEDGVGQNMAHAIWNCAQKEGFDAARAVAEHFAENWSGSRPYLPQNYMTDVRYALARRGVFLPNGSVHLELAAVVGVSPARARMAVWSKELEPEDLRRMADVQEYRVRLWKHRRGMKR